MKNIKAILAVLALTPVLVACGGEKPVEITNGFGQKMEVLCKADKIRFAPGQDGVDKSATEFRTVDEWVAIANKNTNGNSFVVGLTRGFYQAGIDYACK